MVRRSQYNRVAQPALPGKAGAPLDCSGFSSWACPLELVNPQDSYPAVFTSSPTQVGPTWGLFLIKCASLLTVHTRQTNNHHEISLIYVAYCLRSSRVECREQEVRVMATDERDI